jgi:hypothetical protein
MISKFREDEQAKTFETRIALFHKSNLRTDDEWAQQKKKRAC